MTFSDWKERRVGSRVRVRVVGRTAVVLFAGAFAAAMALVPAAARAGSVDLVSPPAGGADGMNSCPFLVGPGANPLSGEFFAPAADRAGAAVAAHEGNPDRAFEYRDSGRLGFPAAPATTGLFLPAAARLRGEGGVGVAIRHAAELSNGPGTGSGVVGTADQSSSGSDQGNPGAGGAMVSVPLPTSIFLGPAGLVLAGYASRRLRRRR